MDRSAPISAMTLVEKVIARAAGRDAVRPGEIVTAQVDFAFAHDSSGPRRWFVDPDRRAGVVGVQKCEDRDPVRDREPFGDATSGAALNTAASTEIMGRPDKPGDDEHEKFRSYLDTVEIYLAAAVYFDISVK